MVFMRQSRSDGESEMGNIGIVGENEIQGNNPLVHCRIVSVFVPNPLQTAVSPLLCDCHKRASRWLALSRAQLCRVQRAPLVSVGTGEIQNRVR